MKKNIFVLALISFFSLANLYAMDAVFKIAPVFSFMSQTQKEFLFIGPASANNHKISELNWEMNNVGMVGIVFDSEINRFTFRTSFLSALPSACGTVHDSDWENIRLKGILSDSLAGCKTKYSESSSHLDFYENLSFQANLKLFEQNCFRFLPYAAADFIYCRDSAMGLTKWYGKEKIASTSSGEKYRYHESWNSVEPETSYDSDEIVMQLDRFYGITWIGIRMELNAADRVLIAVQAGLSPFTGLYSIDSHLVSKSYYNDRIISLSKMINYGIELTFNFDQHLSLYLNASQTFSSLMEGSTYSSHKKHFDYTLDSDYFAGASFHSKQFVMGYRYSF